MSADRHHGIFFHLFDVVLNIVIIVGVVATVRTFLVSPFQVEGNSMLSTLEHKQYIIINKLAYHTGSPERGDVVVFHPPTTPDKPYVKRVIGMPGDTVVIEDGYVYLQQGSQGALMRLNEYYLNASNNGHTYQSPPSSGNTGRISFAVPEGRYFLMGDNRQGSLDSRSFRDGNGDPIPFVEEDAIMGRVWLVALPISKMHVMEQPIYDL